MKTTSGTLHSQHVSIQSFSQGRLLGSKNIAAWWLAKARPGMCPKARPCVQRSELGPRIVEAVHTCNKHHKRNKEIKLKKAFFTFYENKDNSTSQCLGDVSRTAQYFRLLKVARIVKTLRIIRIFKLGICSQKYLPLRNISVSKSSVASHRSSYAIQSLLALV